MKLTGRQQQVLAFIEDSQSESGVVPSTREIQQHFGFASQTAAMNHLRALERKGVIQRRPRKARAMSVTSLLARSPIMDIPIFGAITAGMAQDSDPESDGTISVDIGTLGLGRNASVFALKVKGDSMSGAQINDGDLVVLERRTPKARDIVAALIDGETTLKRFVLRADQAYLQAENPAYPDLIPVRELVIQGVMVALIRRCREN